MNRSWEEVIDRRMGLEGKVSVDGMEKGTELNRDGEKSLLEVRRKRTVEGEGWE